MSERFVAETPQKRLDLFLCVCMPQNTRSHLKKWVEDGFITVNGKPAKAAQELRAGDEVCVTAPRQAERIDLAAEDIPLDIVYQDADLAVINKSQGMTVHPAETVKSGTLVNALLYHIKDLSGINGEIRPGIVHRIDKNTSGLIVIAKNDAAHVALSAQIADKTCFRIYRALLEGVVNEDSGTIDAPIGRSPRERKQMAVVTGGRHAVTHFTVLERFAQHTYMEFRLETGRTHQIRVHAKHIGHPVVGDDVYGFQKQKWNLNGQLLHAYQLSFVHPATGERLTFTAPLPDYFEKILKSLENTLHSSKNLLY